ncbi:MAG: phage head closure protein [Lachnospiraceae bacterium]
MDAGAYRTKITIQKKTTTKDAIGNSVVVWEDDKFFHAYANGLSGREYWEAAQVQGENTVDFTIRWHPYFDQINNKEYQLVMGEKVFNIRTIDNIQFKNETVKIRGVHKQG